ncbi:hypothetical protein FXO38_27030 [Capsicum annuum]|nr:hypothetical protein FXO38_27030 [Capsicum annuum]
MMSSCCTVWSRKSKSIGKLGHMSIYLRVQEKFMPLPFAIRVVHHPDPFVLPHRSAYLSPIEVAATFDSKMFGSMGYVLVKDEWCKKESACAKAEPPKVSKSVSNLSTSLLKELEELKQRIKAIDEGSIKLQESTTTLLDLGKSTSSDISMVRLAIDGLKQERVRLFS